VYAPIYFSPLALVIYYFLFRLANLPVTNENKNIKHTTIVQLGRGQPNNSFAVILLLLLSVVFYGFRLNGNWGVHSMFPRIHVLQPNRDRYQLHTHIQGKNKKRLRINGRNAWGLLPFHFSFTSLSPSITLSIITPAAPENDGANTFTQLCFSGNRHIVVVVRPSPGLPRLSFSSPGAAQQKERGFSDQFTLTIQPAVLE
jgi:hypothetical protein